MNSEELELSLRTEFENYLKGVLAEMRHEAADLQQRLEGEFDQQRARVNEAVTAFAARFDADAQFDEAFRSTVAEHLRLARDEGAAITANAFAEAEKLEKENAPAPVANYDGIRDAVADISSKDSQSSILKSLVEHAQQFAPRGAFFIIKNEQFTGWKVFGDGTDAAENAIRDVSFPVAADSVLGTSIRSLATVDSSSGTHSEDTSFLEPLQFGFPDKMYAIPLIVRGKGVAVLYADPGTSGVQLNREALETLVRVAGLTVELIALAQAPRVEEPVREAVETREEAFPHTPAPVAEFTETREESFQPTPEPVADFAETSEESFQPTSEPVAEFTESREESFAPQPVAEEQSFEDTVHEVPFEVLVEEPVPSTAGDFAFSETGSDETSFQHEGAPATVEEPEPEPAFAETQPSFEPETEPETSPAPEPAFATPSPFGTTAEEYAPAGAPMGTFEPAVEVATQAPTTRTRLSDRPVDLPIEVPDEERRLHNDARRFARLLVSEIKLYNERKVIEGREASDLYDRLREAIDRSREMYDKRVQPPVAAKFDYFHYELVNALAEGDSGRLGSGYPGATI